MISKNAGIGEKECKRNKKKKTNEECKSKIVRMLRKESKVYFLIQLQEGIL